MAAIEEHNILTVDVQAIESETLVEKSEGMSTAGIVQMFR